MHEKKPREFRLGLGLGAEQWFLVSAASVQIMANPLSWLVDEDLIDQAIQLLRHKKAPESSVCDIWLCWVPAHKGVKGRKIS